MSVTLKTLYKRDSKGNVQQWTMHILNDGYYVVEGLKDGKKTTSKPHICEAKNTGKKNATTAAEQAAKEAQAKWEHKLEHGYALSEDAIDATGYLEPMLAKKLDDYKEDLEFPCYVDDKLNGVRLNALKGSVKSRRGKPFNTIPHIIEALAPLFKKYPKLFLDGELFNPKLKNHLNRLIEIASVAYKPKDVTPELLAESLDIVQFHVYDGYGFEGITAETPFTQRRAALAKLLKGIAHVFVLKTVECATFAQIMKLLDATRKAGDEGIIVRHGTCKYEHKRSKYLLKGKNFDEDEFEIADIESGNADWNGYAKRIVLQLPKPVIGRDGEIQTTFASNIEGDRAYLQKLLINKEDVIGKLATVRFLGYSEYSIPQIPYVVAIRDYE